MNDQSCKQSVAPGLQASSGKLAVAIPLNRPEIKRFLLPPGREAQGVVVETIRQQPSLRAQLQWAQGLNVQGQPSLESLLALDKPGYWLHPAPTDRLVPAKFLRLPGFLSRNLGGWTPIYFGVLSLAERDADPLLARLEVLTDYGPRIRTFGARLAQVASRLGEELGLDAEALWPALRDLLASRPGPGSANASSAMTHARQLYEKIRGGRLESASSGREIPLAMWLDELRFWLVEIELLRRAADAEDDAPAVEAIADWQTALQDETGLRLILKGEYIVGRHRRSTVLIAPELGLVLKQPGPEPFHEIVLGAKTYGGLSENWPRLTRDGALVTPRGRVRLVLEEGHLTRLHDVLKHPMTFHSFLGITLEPYVHGPTTQELVLEDPAALTPALYEVYVLHQLVAEAIGVENGDWHSANFVRRSDGSIVHIDWGAARPLQPGELTTAGRRSRLHQVRNIGFSFHDEALATKTAALHEALVADADRLRALRRRAEAMAGKR
jgi:hypothetical protein